MKLLVSVKDFEEFKVAMTCFVDIIDLKDPENGSLAAVSSRIANEAIAWASRKHTGPIIPTEAVIGTTPISTSAKSIRPYSLLTAPTTNPVLSLAMGELSDYRKSSFQTYPLTKFDFAKIGLAGMTSDLHWTDKWVQWSQSLPSNVCPVPVAYADWKIANSPSLDQVVSLAIQRRSSYVLVDTFSKDGKTLFDFLSIEQLNYQLSRLKTSNSLVPQIAVAGSLGPSNLTELDSIPATILAVRGSVCQNAKRKSQLDKQLVDQLASKIYRQSKRN